MNPAQSNNNYTFTCNMYVLFYAGAYSTSLTFLSKCAETG